MKKITAIFYSVFVVLAGLYVFFAAPNLNPMYADGAFFWLIIITIALIVPAIGSLKAVSVSVSSGQPKVNWDKNAAKLRKWIIIPLVIMWVAYFLVNIIFTPLFFSKQYKNQMAEPVVKSFSSEVQAVDISQIPIVDKSLAATLADKKLGEKPSLGSQVSIGEPTIQMVDGQLIWAVPLHHSGLFKWLSNMSGSAGYIKVSATNMKDVTYVEDYKIKIQPNSYFLDDLTRRTRFTQGLTSGITDYSFEIDDSGKPYWVVTTYKPTCGFGLPEATGVIIVDAQDGSAEKFTLDNVPEWVDRVQPEDFILKQINNKGEYINGVFNFSNKGKFKTSEGENIVYNNGNCYLFTGVTSVGADESAIGFYMVDMVTKQPIMYNMSGATEKAAMKSAEGKVQDLRYTATFPIIVNVNNEPTYFMTLKDSAQLIKKYAFVSVQDYSVVGVGDTVALAKDDYANAMHNTGMIPEFDTEKPEQVVEKVEAIVDRINWNVVENTTTYTFTVEGKPNIYVVTSDKSVEMPLTQKGDAVSFECVKVKDNIYQLKTFDNTTIPAK